MEPLECDTGGFVWFGVMIAIAFIAWFIEKKVRRAEPRWVEEIAHSWQNLATKLDGSLSPGERSDPTRPWPELAATVDSVRLYVALSGWSSTQHKFDVTITTPIEHGDFTLDLRPTPQDRGSVVVIKVSIKSCIQDDIFNDRFMFTTNDEDLAVLWLNDAVRQNALLSNKYTYSVREQKITARTTIYELHHDHLIAAAKTVAALSKHGADLVRVTDELAKHFNGSASQHPSSESTNGFEDVLLLPSATIRLDRIRHSVGVVSVQTHKLMRLRAETRNNAAPFTAVHKTAPKDTLETEGLTAFTHSDPDIDQSYWLESSDPERTAQRLDTAICRMLLDAAPKVVVDDGHEVTLLFEGFTRTKDELVSPVELLIGLVGAQQGPYR